MEPLPLRRGWGIAAMLIPLQHGLCCKTGAGWMQGGLGGAPSPAPLTLPPPLGRGEGSVEEPRGAAPGRRDLEAAVQRLSARQQSHASEERSFFEAERERKLWRLRDGESSSGFLTPNESIVSTGTNHSGGSELTAGSGFSLGSLTYLPDKLQIVKPLEGEGYGGCLVPPCSPGGVRGPG